MRLRVEAKLRKAIRRLEHGHPGLQAAIARHERRGEAPAEALVRFVVDPAEGWYWRQVVAGLLWKMPGTKSAGLSMVRLVANTGSTDVMTAYLGACSERKNITPAELKLFQVVLDKGSLEEQIRAVEALAFVPQRPVRRTLIGILSNSAAPLDVRERATEMLHLHESRETAEACAKALAIRAPASDSGRHIRSGRSRASAKESPRLQHPPWQASWTTARLHRVVVRGTGSSGKYCGVAGRSWREGTPPSRDSTRPARPDCVRRGPALG